MILKINTKLKNERISNYNLYSQGTVMLDWLPELLLSARLISWREITNNAGLILSVPLAILSTFLIVKQLRGPRSRPSIEIIGGKAITDHVLQRSRLDFEFVFLLNNAKGNKECALLALELELKELKVSDHRSNKPIKPSLRADFIGLYDEPIEIRVGPAKKLHLLTSVSPPEINARV